MTESPPTDAELDALELAFNDPNPVSRVAAKAAAASRLLAEVRRLRDESETMANALWAIIDGDSASAQDRIIAAGGLGSRYDHSKPHGR